MITINDKRDCSGCTACYAICGRHAIEMREDPLGFKYPVVDTEKCVECGLCDKVCAFNDIYSTPDNLDRPIALGGRHKDIEEVDKSRSGGIFAALSDAVLSEGGVIYGAGYDSSFRVIHKRATDPSERDELRGSKYVQSDIGNIFLQVESDIKANRKVLFSGTPCQTAGLSSFLRLRKVNCDRLLICDIVCHGVPSPYIWRDYLKYIQKKERQKIIDVNFRDKLRFGWSAHKESFKLENKYISTCTYTNAYFQHIMIRRSCEVCHYTNLRRTGDITLADFWGWEKSNPDMNKDDKGISLILVNTNKGARHIEQIKNKILSFPVNIEQALQPNLQSPSSVHPGREQFEKDYERFGFEKSMSRHALIGWKHDVVRIMDRIKRKVHNVARKFRKL